MSGQLSPHHHRRVLEGSARSTTAPVVATPTRPVMDKPLTKGILKFDRPTFHSIRQHFQLIEAAAKNKFKPRNNERSTVAEKKNMEMDHYL
jgi:hypothetical protein